MGFRIAPSIFMADPLSLGAAVESVASADLLHIDVMDLHFVPNLAMGISSVERLAEVSPIPLDAHLMIDDPDRWAMRWADAGCAIVTFHVEASKAPIRLVRNLRGRGVQAGIAVNPGTPIASLVDLLGEVDMLLIMTVEPGFGGQSLIERSLARIAEAHRLADSQGLDLDIQVDGGVSRATIGRLARAGARVFVVGAAIFGAPDRPSEIAALRALAEEAATDDDAGPSHWPRRDA